MLILPLPRGGEGCSNGYTLFEIALAEYGYGPSATTLEGLVDVGNLVGGTLASHQDVPLQIDLEG